MTLVTVSKSSRQLLRKSQLAALSDLGRLALGISTGALLGGYGRASYAGTCAPLALGVYQCTGAANVATDTTQSFAAGTTDIVVTSDPDFGLDTRVAGGDGISASGSSGSIEITTSGVVAAVTGIQARTSGNFYDYAGDITITTGNVSGGITGISTYSYLSGFGGDTTIDTTAGTVFGGVTGIAASVSGDYFSGYINITTADVAGVNTGVFAANDPFNGAITIDTTAGTVTAGSAGIVANAGYSSGGAQIRTSDVNAISGVGISTRGDATVNTSAGVVRAGTDGIRLASEDSFGGVSTGDVIAGRNGVYARGLGVSINTTSGHVEAGEIGIDSRSCCYGSYIRTSDVTAGGDGIRALGYARNSLVDSTGGSVSSGRDGIYTNSGSDSFLEISTGDVTGAQYGINANDAYALTIDTTAGTVTGGTDGISVSASDGAYIKVSSADIVAGSSEASSGSDDESIVIETVSADGTSFLRDATTGAAGVRLTGEAFDGAFVELSGRVSGDIGIDVSRFSSDVEIKTSGLIEGRSEVALHLGDGQQSLAIFDELTGLSSPGQQGIIGDSYFGGGDDMLSFVDTVSGGNILYDGMFSDLFDGGSETDTALFSVAFEDLKFQGGSGSFIQLFFQGEENERAMLSLVNFELFSFADDPEATYTVDEIRSLVAPVPLPTGVLLLGSALGLLSFAQKSRKRTARDSS